MNLTRLLERIETVNDEYELIKEIYENDTITSQQITFNQELESFTQRYETKINQLYGLLGKNRKS